MNLVYTQILAASKFVRDPSIRWKVECLLRGLKHGNVTLACAQFGIHRTTFYRWLTRLEQHAWNPAVLHPRSRRPHHHPRTITGEKKDRILWHRRKFQYGPDRIAWYLCGEGHRVSSHGVYNVLKREGTPFRKRKDQKRNPHTKRYELDRPGQGIQLDIKYVPFPIENKRAYVFNAIDECSRWRFQYAYRLKTKEQACDFIQRLVDAAPFPIEQIQTDNDPAFTNRFLRSPAVDPPYTPHPFPKILLANNIHHRLLPPGMKELNGKVERSHKTDDQEFYWKLPPWLSFEECQRQLHRWTYEYNHFRPHSSLNMKTPIQRLADFNLPPKNPTAGLWITPDKPSHYTFVDQKLNQYRKLHSEQNLIHWTFKAKGPQQSSISPWLPGTPLSIRLLSHFFGMTTAR